MRGVVRSERGQTSTEYMMMISVVVIAVVAAAYTFVPSFQDGVSSLAQDTSSILDSGTVGSTGTSHDSGGTSGGAPSATGPRPGGNNRP